MFYAINKLDIDKFKERCQQRVLLCLILLHFIKIFVFVIIFLILSKEIWGMDTLPLVHTNSIPHGFIEKVFVPTHQCSLETNKIALILVFGDTQITYTND